MTDVKLNTSEEQEFPGKIWRRGRFESGILVAAEEKILKIKAARTKPSLYIIPPFADPHIHGGWGKDFHQGQFASLEQELKSRGIFFAVPTLDNCPIDEMRRVAELFREYRNNNPQSIFPFLRVEGPFISSGKKGFQREKFIQAGDKNNIDRFLALEEYRMFTFAPEIPGAVVLVKEAAKLSKIPSIGHSQASYRDFISCYNLGVRHMTHFPNAMSGLHHRDLGLTGAGLLHTDLHLEVIADGIHSAPEFIRLLLKIKGPSFGLASDMIPPAFSELGEFDARPIIKSGRQLTTREGILAGGATSLPEQAALLHRLQVTPEDIVHLAALNTRIFFNHPIPELKAGAEASFLILNDKMELQRVVYRGKILPPAGNKEGKKP